MLNLSKFTSSFTPFASLLTFLASLLYGYFIFTDRLGLGFYMYVDLLVFVILLFNIIRSNYNGLFIISLVWLVALYFMKYGNMKINFLKSRQIWTAYDGFTLAVLLNTMPMLHSM
jgi:hypothetical protein